VLIDRAVEVGPAAGDLDVGLIDKPSVAHRVPGWAGGVDGSVALIGRELRCGPAGLVVAVIGSARDR
jgi:hypothetical protein